MASFDTTRTAYGSFSAVSNISALIANAASTIISWNDARMTRNALSALSNRELEDIGLIRGDIEAVAQSRFIR